MPTELKGASSFRKALKKFAPDLDKEVREEMLGFLKPLVKKAKGFMPSDSDMPSGFVKHEVKTSKFPMYDSRAAKRGIGYKMTATRPNSKGWSQTVSIHNKTAAGAIYETAGRKSGIVGNFTPRLPGTLEGARKVSGRSIFKSLAQDEGKAKAGIIKALEKAADKFNARNI